MIRKQPWSQCNWAYLILYEMRNHQKRSPSSSKDCRKCVNLNVKRPFTIHDSVVNQVYFTSYSKGHLPWRSQWILWESAEQQEESSSTNREWTTTKLTVCEGDSKNEGDCEGCEGCEGCGGCEQWCWECWWVRMGQWRCHWPMVNTISYQRQRGYFGQETPL